MGRIIEAKAVISAEDRTGKVLDGIAKNFRDVGKGAKASVEVGRLAKQLDAAHTGLRNIDRFRATQATFGQARAAYRVTQAEVARIAKSLEAARKASAAFDGVKATSKAMAAEMTAARKEAVELERQFATAQRAVKHASSAYEAQATAIKAARREAETSGVSIGKIASEQVRLKAAVEGTSQAILRQMTLERSGGTIAAGMGVAGRKEAERVAAGRRLADGMGASAKAEREAQARARHEAEQTELRRRASASGDLIDGMGSIGRRTAEHIEQGRRVAEGMGAAGRDAREEQERHAQVKAEAQAQRRADRRDAAGTVAAGATLYAGHKGKEIGLEAINAAAEMDYAVRYQHVVTDVSEATQQRLLIPQAKRIGQETKFANRDIVEAQTTTMTGLPFKDPEVRAEVGAAMVDQARYYAVLFRADMERSSQGLRSFLQNTNKDISTPEKAITESQRATNLIVKGAKLGGMNDEDVQQYIQFGLPTATQAGFSDTTTMALAAAARRSGLKGDVAGVFVRAASSKLISPTKQGREAEIMAGIDRSKFQKMPEQVDAEAFEKIGKGRFGVSFNDSQRKRLSAMFKDGDLITDREEFIKRVSGVVGDSFDKVSKGKNKGKLKAQDATKIAKLANDFYQMSVQSTDVEGLLDAHLNSPTFTTALRNKFYTDKHGGKAGILATQFEQLKQDREELLKVTKTPYFARDKAMYMTKGLGGAVDNVKGSYETNVLNWGTKNAPMVQAIADGLAATGDAIADLPDKTVQAATAFTAIAVAGGSAASSLAILGKLTGSAVLMGLAGAGAGAMLPVLGGVAVAGALYAGSDVTKGVVHGGTPDFTMNPADELPGLDGSADKPSWAPPAMVVPNIPLATAGVPSLIDAGRKDRPAAVSAATNDLARHRLELASLRSEANGLADLGLPGVGSGQDARMVEVQARIAKAEERLKGLRTVEPSARPTAFVPPVPAPDPAASPPLPSRMVPAPPARPVEFGGRTIPVEVVSLPAGADRSGQERALGNTLDKAADASTTAANGGKPLEATVKPDQIVAKVTEMPPVSGEATVSIDNRHQIAVTLNSDMLDAKVTASVGKAVAKIPLNSGGGRPGAVSMPGAASAPGAR